MTSASQTGKQLSKGARRSPSPLAFDVASIRETAPQPSYSQYLSDPSASGRFDATDIWINQVLGEAYDVNFRYQITGGPDWLGKQRFAIHATSDVRTDQQLARMSADDQKRAKQGMLQQLLKERFGLKCHIEMKDRSVYFLTRARPSANLHEVTASPGGTGKIVSSGTGTNLTLDGRQAPIQQLTGLLSYYLKTQVVDQTGLEKVYDFTLHFNAHPDLNNEANDEAPPAEIALQQQLGLKLAHAQGPVRVLVIDGIEKPTAN